jgi:hypothetical protein
MERVKGDSRLLKVTSVAFTVGGLASSTKGSMFSSFQWPKWKNLRLKKFGKIIQHFKMWCDNFAF